ncbi:MAG TPA: hypothetical protein VNE41_12875 [Chitinophagaceae bacterium]|nr:hypothetical protein [Chitinophagaceae bacterium]
MRKYVLNGFITALVACLTACSPFRPSEKSNAPLPVASAIHEGTSPSSNIPPAKTPPFNVPVFAQSEYKPVYRIAIFAPLYLNGITDTIKSDPLPLRILPGLEFYEGALMALDSLRWQGFNLDVQVYDTRSSMGIEQILKSTFMDSVNLMIGSVNLEDLRLLSAFSKKHQVNFISATYPNDGNIRNNPFLVILNSTLQTHLEAIREYALQNFGKNKNIILFRRNNARGKKITDILQGENEPLGKMIPLTTKEVIWYDSITPLAVSRNLSPVNFNICIVTSMDENAAANITGKLATLAGKYPLSVIGMPTWDGMSAFSGTNFQGINIFYSTPYYNDKKDPWSQYIIKNYRNTYKILPPDMVFKGFEATYYFCELLKLYGLYFNRYINDPRYQLITPYDLEPVYHRSDSLVPDYFENRKIYFIKVYNGLRYKAS